MEETTKRDESLTLAQERTDLAAARNLLAADRTLLAWVRTAVALIVFGFTIYRVMESLYKSGLAFFPRSHGPRNLGLTLIATGTLSLLVATIFYMRYVKLLGFNTRSEMWKVTIAVAFLVVLIGTLVLFSILAGLDVF
jgi:putative membrane protein